MQNKIRNRVFFTAAKVQMLKLYWSQVVNWLLKSKSDHIKKLANNFGKIKDDVQNYVCLRLVTQIKKLSTINTSY